MKQLDPPTLIAMAGIMAAHMAVVLFFMRRHYPPHIRGLGYWAAAPVLWLVAAALFGGRGVLPGWISIVAANALLLLGSVTHYIGCRRFLEHGGGWGLWSTAVAGSMLVFAALAAMHAPYPLRLGLFTMLLLCLYAAQLRFLLRYGGRRFPVRLVEVLICAHIAVLLTRLASVVMGQAGSDLMEPSFQQTLYVGAYALAALLLCVGAMLMATDRLTTELQHLATYDALTGALNRRVVIQHCEDELLRSRRSGKGPALLMIDLDHFKELNDTHGHQHGDAVLAHFVQRTQSVLRGMDRLGRYGGEEFLVLLPETGAADAQAVALRIHAALDEGHALDCRMSIGMTACQGPHDTLDAMLTRADRALYQAKGLGRNRTCAA